jgi:uncharacterized protein Smg (DUF494 family)
MFGRKKASQAKRRKITTEDVQRLDQLVTTFIEFLPNVKNLDDDERESLSKQARLHVLKRTSELLQQWSDPD